MPCIPGPGLCQSAFCLYGFTYSENTSYKWNHTTCGPLYLTSFTVHNIFQVLPHCSRHQDFSYFYGWIVFHCICRLLIKDSKKMLCVRVGKGGEGSLVGDHLVPRCWEGIGQNHASPLSPAYPRPSKLPREKADLTLLRVSSVTRWVKSRPMGPNAVNMSQGPNPPEAAHAGPDPSS